MQPIHINVDAPKLLIRVLVGIRYVCMFMFKMTRFTYTDRSLDLEGSKGSIQCVNC